MSISDRLRRRSTVTSVLVGGVAGVTALAGSLGLVTSSASATARVVRVGERPAFPAGATALGLLPTSSRLQAIVTLEPSDAAALAAYATAVSTPGTADYRAYLTTAQFAARFGPTPAQIAAVRSVLRSDGLHPGTVTADHLAIDIDGTAATFAHAFSTGFARYRLVGGRVAYANTAAPLLPASIASNVQAVIGLDDLVLAHPENLSTSSRSPRAVSPHLDTNTGGPQACSAARKVAASQGAFTADQLAATYRYSKEYKAGDLGAGETIAMYELEPNSPSDVKAYESCYGVDTSVRYVKVDGGDGTGAGSGESILDIDVALGEAPKANQLVYQGKNNATGPYATYNAIISQDKAQIVSTSWGACESQEGLKAAQAENTLFQEAAAQGQSILDASGDDGSEDCGNKVLAVDDPGSQPFITAVGGLKITSLGTPPVEQVWNESKIKAGAGGGGISTFWTMPDYQSGAAPALSVINPDSSGTPCGATSGTYCREVPDVSMDADPQTGYTVYHAGQWGAVGGTSAAAPMFASLMALTDASDACAGTKVGFVNPSLYSIAGSSYAADFLDITKGNDDYTGTNSGLFPSAVGYDMASGLGAPKGAFLPAALCSLGR